MEPMTLGTPSGSPAPPEQYLPCFLLGEKGFSQTPRRNRLSPKDRNLPFGNLRSPSSLSSSFNNDSDKPKSAMSIKFGPPIIDLYDDIPSICKMPTSTFSPENLPRRDSIYNQKESTRNSCYDYNSPLNGSMPYPFNPNVTFNNQSAMFQSPQFGNSQISASEVFNSTTNIKSPIISGAKRGYPYPDTSFQSAYDASLMSNNYSNRPEQEYWVTVFGFIPEMSADVQNYFQNVSNVIDKYIKSDCNYICLKYASRLEARQVLAYNGYLFKPGIIIGVTLCDDPEQIGRDVCNPINNEYESKAKWDKLRYVPQPSIRTSPPIIQAKKKRKENNGLVGKAIDYIMGW